MAGWMEPSNKNKRMKLIALSENLTQRDAKALMHSIRHLTHDHTGFPPKTAAKTNAMEP